MYPSPSNDTIISRAPSLPGISALSQFHVDPDSPSSFGVISHPPALEAAPHPPTVKQPLPCVPSLPAPNVSHDASESEDTGTRVRKTRAEFTYTDIEKLISGVLHVDPYMCKRTETKDKWQTVLSVVQGNGGCKGRDWQTIRNKVKNLLKMVGVSTLSSFILLTKLSFYLQKPDARATFSRSSLARELENDPQRFTTLSGRLDAVAALKKHAEQILEEERGQVKEVSTGLSKGSMLT